MGALLIGASEVFYVMALLLSICGLLALICTVIAAAVGGALTLAALTPDWDKVVYLFAAFLAIAATAMAVGAASWLLKMAVPYVA